MLLNQGSIFKISLGYPSSILRCSLTVITGIFLGMHLELGFISRQDQGLTGMGHWSSVTAYQAILIPFAINYKDILIPFATSAKESMVSLMSGRVS